MPDLETTLHTILLDDKDTPTDPTPPGTDKTTTKGAHRKDKPIKYRKLEKDNQYHTANIQA